MTEIIFIENDGTEHVVEAEIGKSVMQTALDHMVPGIVGDCGGCCTCATCHGFIDEKWLNKLSPKSEDETMMLEGALDVRLNSRLTCQISVTPELQGIIIRLPEKQF